jgi:hypothetical protein
LLSVSSEIEVVVTYWCESASLLTESDQFEEDVHEPPERLMTQSQEQKKVNALKDLSMDALGMRVEGDKGKAFPSTEDVITALREFGFRIHKQNEERIELTDGDILVTILSDWSLNGGKEALRHQLEPIFKIQDKTLLEILAMSNQSVVRVLSWLDILDGESGNLLARDSISWEEMKGAGKIKYSIHSKRIEELLKKPREQKKDS